MLPPGPPPPSPSSKSGNVVLNKWDEMRISALRNEMLYSRHMNCVKHRVIKCLDLKSVDPIS